MNQIRLKIVIIISFTLITLLVYSDISKTKEELLSQAYGYLIGQEYSLSEIEKAHPDLKMKVKKVRLNFNSVFNQAEENIESELKLIFGDYFITFKSEIKNQLQGMLKIKPYNKEDALNFLAEVNERANGEIENPVLETLLTYQFINNPSIEFTRGFIKSYSTKGYPKSKDIIVNAKIPLSWKQKETERPNIVHKFTSFNGIGLESIMFMVKDLGLPKDYIVTQEELEEIFIESELIHLAPENSVFISAKRIYLDGQISGEVIFSSTIRRLDFSIKMKSIHFISIVEGKMFFLQCGVTTLKNQDLESKFNLYLPLFRKVANSLVFPSKYKYKPSNNSVDSAYNTRNLDEYKSDIEQQKDMASRKMDEGIGRIGAFLLIISFYIIFKTVQWFLIRKKLSESMLDKAHKNINRLGKYSKIWAVIQFLSSLFFVMSWQVTNLIVMTLISILVYWAGHKLSKKNYYSFKSILSIFSVTSFFSFIIPIIAVILMVQDETTLGKFGFLWLKLFNELQIIRFGPAFLTLILCFFSVSSMFSYLVIKKYDIDNTNKIPLTD